MDSKGLFTETLKYLDKKKHILFLTTSNRWKGEKGGEKPKSSLLAERFADILGRERVVVIDVTSLKIHPCEGNVSTLRGNTCGEKAALLTDALKNPSGCHRCWASLNNPDDELWIISREILHSDCVVFFGSVRWGQMNGYYQKLIERLTWMENRHSTLKENNILRDIDAGLIAIGHNWNEEEVIATQKQVLSFFGFNAVDELFRSWKFTEPEDESEDSYRKAAETFSSEFLKDA